jgi:hypothetical protein
MWQMQISVDTVAERRQPFAAAAPRRLGRGTTPFWHRPGMKTKIENFLLSRIVFEILSTFKAK